MAKSKENDPISVFLKCQLANRKYSQSKAEDDKEESSIDSSIVASARRILESKVEFEKVPGYSASVEEKLKGKYKLLVVHKKISVTSEAEGASNEAHVRNSRGLPLRKSSGMGISYKKMNIESAGGGFPFPSVPSMSLFPENAIKLGWKGNEPVGAGMLNLGNTCYLNSILQALFHIPSFCNWLSSETVHNGTGKCDQAFIAGEMCTICAMAATLRVSMAQTGNVMKPALIYGRLRSICKHLSLGHQEDAHEFLRFLIESMERTFLLRYKGKKLDNLSKETTPLHRIFGGYLRNEVACHSCGTVSTTFQLFQDLFLDIRHADTLLESMRTFFSREKLEGGESKSDCYKCEKCKNKGNCTKRVYIQTPPNVLCVQLKRFTALGKKIMKHVKYPLKLDLSPYVYNKLSSQNNSISLQHNILRPIPYKLVSIVSHYGTALSCGHYTALGKSAKGPYFIFDDSLVQPVSLSSALGASAYILMYEMEPGWNNFLESKRNSTMEKVDNILLRNLPTKLLETYNLQKLQAMTSVHSQVESTSPKSMLPLQSQKDNQLVPKSFHLSSSRAIETNYLKPAAVKMKSFISFPKNPQRYAKPIVNGMVDRENASAEVIPKAVGIAQKAAEGSSSDSLDKTKQPVRQPNLLSPSTSVNGVNDNTSNANEQVPLKPEKMNKLYAVEESPNQETGSVKQQMFSVLQNSVYCSPKESLKISSPKSRNLKRISSLGSEENMSSSCKRQLTMPDVFSIKNIELEESGQVLRPSSQPKIRTIKDWLEDRNSVAGTAAESIGKQLHHTSITKSWSVNGWKVTENKSPRDKRSERKRKMREEIEPVANKRKRFNKVVNSELQRTLSQSKIPFLNSNNSIKKLHSTGGNDKEKINGMSTPFVSLTHNSALFQKM